MFEQIKRLGTDTAIYGISTVLARLLNFALVPLYANTLTTADNGVVAYLYSFIALATVFYSYGMESSYFRFAATNETGTPKQNFSTPFYAIGGVSLLLSAGIAAGSAPLAEALQLDRSLDTVLRYTAGILLFDALALVPYASLRLQRRASFFALTKVLNIVLTVALNIVTVYGLRWGVEGIFFSNLCASVLSFVILLPGTLRQLEAGFSVPLFRQLLAFGLPIVPVGLSGVLLQIVDRPILKLLMDDASLGIYQVNYRLGIFMALVTGMFEYAWRPFFLTHAKEPDAKRLFARVMTYYLLGTLALFLVLSFYLGDIVKVIFPPAYWTALDIVPLIMLSYILSGVGTNLNAGIQIEKKTGYLFPTSLAGSVTKLVLTFLLVPWLGVMGAAVATVFGYLMVEATLYPVVQRVYRIEYEFRRIGILLVTVTAAFFLGRAAGESVFLKGAVLAAWGASLYLAGFFTPGELRRVRSLFGNRP